jgi:hypothetical protein
MTIVNFLPTHTHSNGYCDLNKKRNHKSHQFKNGTSHSKKNKVFLSYICKTTNKWISKYLFSQISGPFHLGDLSYNHFKFSKIF